MTREARSSRFGYRLVVLPMLRRARISRTRRTKNEGSAPRKWPRREARPSRRQTSRRLMALFGSHTKKSLEARDATGLLSIAADPKARHRSDALMAVIELVGDDGASSPFAEETSRIA